jgi:uncharacterized protein (DUF302 family)
METVTAEHQVRHVTVSTEMKYESVKTRIEAEVNRLDDSFRQLLAENKIEELREKLEEASRPHGLMIHYVATHGDWLALTGKRRRGVVYHIGNVLMAIRMTQHAFGAGLYAPLRLAVYENASGGTNFEYDLPSTQFGLFQNAKIDEVAKKLDARLVALIETISSYPSPSGGRT